MTDWKLKGKFTVTDGDGKKTTFTEENITSINWTLSKPKGRLEFEFVRYEP